MEKDRKYIIFKASCSKNQRRLVKQIYLELEDFTAYSELKNNKYYVYRPSITLKMHKPEIQKYLVTDKELRAIKIRQINEIGS